MAVEPQSINQTHVELRPNQAGQMRAFIAGTRVRVQDIYVCAELHGKTPDEIVAALPHLTLAQVHGALAYYFDHREEILKECQQEEQFAAKKEAEQGPTRFSRLRDQLLKDRNGNDPLSS